MRPALQKLKSRQIQHRLERDIKKPRSLQSKLEIRDGHDHAIHAMLEFETESEMQSVLTNNDYRGMHDSMKIYECSHWASTL